MTTSQIHNTSYSIWVYRSKNYDRTLAAVIDGTLNYLLMLFTIFSRNYVVSDIIRHVHRTVRTAFIPSFRKGSPVHVVSI
jgi:hypothetical protein